MTAHEHLREWALRHPRVLTTPLRVLFYCLPDLDGRYYRPIKQEAVAKALRISQPSVSEALMVLVQEAYLNPGPRDGRLKTYRLNLTHLALEQLIHEHVRKN